MPEKHVSVWTVIVAAGRGERFGRPYNKIFHSLDGRSVLMRCIDALTAANVFDGAVLVLSNGDVEAYQQLTAAEGVPPLIKKIALGGNTRRQSVMNGLTALPSGVDIVAVHDAARPFVDPRIIQECIASAREYGSGIPATPVTDTIKETSGDGFAYNTLKRECLCAVQTPQVFPLDRLLAAHAQPEDICATDDASLYEHLFGRVHLVMLPECRQNIKLTTPEDLSRCMRPVRPRVGTGFDAHRLTAGRELVLCGIKIPFEKGLLGHSDADVAVHALMDAMLGAMGAGDIGGLFPDSDPQYEGISSMKLLARVMDMARAMNMWVENFDMTIIAQRPKLKPYIAEMRDNVAQILGIESGQANIKATTTEGMGYEGEGLGISAQAVVLMCVCK